MRIVRLNPQHPGWDKLSSRWWFEIRGTKVRLFYSGEGEVITDPIVDVSFINERVAEGVWISENVLSRTKI